MKILKMFGINGTFGKITYREYQKTEYLRNDSEAKEILQEKISDFLESLDIFNIFILWVFRILSY